MLDKKAQSAETIKKPKKGRPVSRVISTAKHKKAMQIVVDHFGSAIDVAKSVGVTVQPVYSWLGGRSVIPLFRAEQIQKLTRKKITVLQLRPDLESFRKYFQ